MKRYLAMVLAGLLMLTGCARSHSQVRVQQEEEFDFAHQDSIQEQITEYVTVDTKVHVPEAFADGTGNTYEMEILGGKKDTEMLQQKFLKDQEIVNVQGDPESNVNYIIENDSYLHVESITFSYTTVEGSAISQVLDYADSKYGLSEFSQETDLDFKPMAEVKQEVFQLIESLGAEPDDACEIYAVPYTKAMEAEEKLKESIEEQSSDMPSPELFNNWTKEQDCYYMKIFQQIDGYPMTRYNVGEEDTYVPASEIELIYTSKGIIEITALSRKNPVLVEEKQDLLTADEALESIRKFYQSTYIDQKEEQAYISYEEIRDAYLEMVPRRKNGSIEENVVIPVWRFEKWRRSEQNPAIETEQEFDVSEEFAHTGNIFVDARTGEILR